MCPLSFQGATLIEPDLWFSHIRLSDDSCPHRARPCGLGFLCCGFKPPSQGPQCVPRPGSQSHLIQSTVHRKPVEVAALPLPVEFCCLLRYFGTMPASDSLFHPRAGIGGHRIALFCRLWDLHRVSPGQSQFFLSVPSLSTRRGTLWCYSFHPRCRQRYPHNHRVRRLRTAPEGSPPPSGHHGFTVRYGPEIWLRPIRFRLTADTLPLSPTTLERVDSHGSDFH